MQTYQIVIGLGLLVVGIISKYNGLVNMANRVKEGFSLIDVYLKQRYDLLPNLVELAKQYMAHERGLLERITELRTQLYAGNQTEDNKVNVFNQLERNTHQLMVMVENYPQIKASDVCICPIAPVLGGSRGKSSCCSPFLQCSRNPIQHYDRTISFQYPGRFIWVWPKTFAGDPRCRAPKH
jgi:hypothetical protein